MVDKLNQEIINNWYDAMYSGGKLVVILCTEVYR